MAEQSEIRQDLVGFLNSISRPGHDVETIGDDVDLFGAGILDSLALIQIILYLEQQHDIKMGGEGLEAQDLSTVARMLGLVYHASQ